MGAIASLFPGMEIPSLIIAENRFPHNSLRINVAIVANPLSGYHNNLVNM